MRDTAEHPPIANALTVGCTVTSHALLVLDPDASHPGALPLLAPATIGGLEVRDIIRTDGIKFLLTDDAWVLMRTSGTEPLVRIYAEASNMGVVDELLAAGQALVQSTG